MSYIYLAEQHTNALTNKNETDFDFYMINSYGELRYQFTITDNPKEANKKLLELNKADTESLSKGFKEKHLK